MLFREAQCPAIRDGRVTVSFRAWRKPQAKVGGTYALGADGRIEVEAIDLVPITELGSGDAAAAGFANVAELLAQVGKNAPAPIDLSGPLYRIKFRFVPGAKARPVPHFTMAQLIERLDGLDSRAGQPWTRDTLAAIAAHPRVRAAELAAESGRAKLDFKADVRKLKALGLTESFEVGYGLTPRGKELLAVLPTGTSG